MNNQMTPHRLEECLALQELLALDLEPTIPELNRLTWELMEVIQTGQLEEDTVVAASQAMVLISQWLIPLLASRLEVLVAWLAVQ